MWQARENPSGCACSPCPKCRRASPRALRLGRDIRQGVLVGRLGANATRPLGDRSARPHSRRVVDLGWRSWALRRSRDSAEPTRSWCSTCRRGDVLGGPSGVRGLNFWPWLHTWRRQHRPRLMGAIDMYAAEARLFVVRGEADVRRTIVVLTESTGHSLILWRLPASSRWCSVSLNRRPSPEPAHDRAPRRGPGARGLTPARLDMTETDL